MTFLRVKKTYCVHSIGRGLFRFLCVYKNKYVLLSVGLKAFSYHVLL